MFEPVSIFLAFTRIEAFPRPVLLWLYSKTLYNMPSNSNVTPLRRSFTSIIQSHLIEDKSGGIILQLFNAPFQLLDHPATTGWHVRVPGPQSGNSRARPSDSPAD